MCRQSLRSFLWNPSILLECNMRLLPGTRPLLSTCLWSRHTVMELTCMTVAHSLFVKAAAAETGPGLLTSQ